MAAVKKIAIAVVAIVAALAMFNVMLAAPAQAGQPLAPKGTSVKYVTLKGGAIGKSLKIEKCRSRGSKWERPAPPADPQARCRGRVNVNIKLKITVKCKPGWMGGRASAVVSIRERLRVFAMAKSMAAISKVKVKTLIRDRVRGKVKAWVNCVKIKKGGHNPPPNPEYCPPGWMGVPPNCHKPPNPPADRKPQVEIITPAHIFEGGNTYVYAKGYDPDGDPVSINLMVTGAAYISGVVRVNQYYDGTLNGGQGAWVSCPAYWTCVRGQAWGQYPGYADVTASVVANGVAGESAHARFRVMDGNTGF